MTIGASKRAVLQHGPLLKQAEQGRLHEVFKTESTFPQGSNIITQATQLTPGLAESFACHASVEHQYILSLHLCKIYDGRWITWANFQQQSKSSAY